MRNELLGGLMGVGVYRGGLMISCMLYFPDCGLRMPILSVIPLTVFMLLEGHMGRGLRSAA